MKRESRNGRYGSLERTDFSGDRQAICSETRGVFVVNTERFQGVAAVYSSRSRIIGSMDRARRAGIHVATSPSRAMAATAPVSTSGSRDVA